MSTQNLVSQTLKPADLTAARKALDDLEAALGGYLLDLSPEQRRALPKLGANARALATDALTLVSQNADFMARSFDVGEFQKDADFHDALQPIYLRLSRLFELCDDTLLAARSNLYAQTLEVYGSAKARGVTQGLDGLTAAMGAASAAARAPAASPRRAALLRRARRARLRARSTRLFSPEPGQFSSFARKFSSSARQFSAFARQNARTARRFSRFARQISASARQFSAFARQFAAFAKFRALRSQNRLPSACLPGRFTRLASHEKEAPARQPPPPRLPS